jgi:hypothetical protein
MLRWLLLTTLLCAGDARTVQDHQHGSLARSVRPPVVLWRRAWTQPEMPGAEVLAEVLAEVGVPL